MGYDLWYWIYYHLVPAVLDLPAVKHCGYGGGDEIDAVIDFTKMIPIYNT